MSFLPSDSVNHVAYLNIVSKNNAVELPRSVGDLPSGSAKLVQSTDPTYPANNVMSGGESADCSKRSAAVHEQSGLISNAPATAPVNSVTNGSKPASTSQVISVSGGSPRQLHRIKEVRSSQGVSDRTLCRRLKIEIHQLRALEDPTADIPLTMLLKISQALEVPVESLLVESNELSQPVLERAKLLKIMKTVASLKTCQLSSRAARLTEMLNEQLIELMPELAHVVGWPEFGSRRGSDSIARILCDEIDTSKLE